MKDPRLHWCTALWPGLPHLWRYGSWAGLTLACGFGVLLDVLAAATWAWTEWIPPGGRAVGWLAIGVLWILSYAEARADLRRLVREWGVRDGLTAEDRRDQWFRAAQEAYLAGDWSAVEMQLTRLLHQEPRDVEARLLLATVKRRQGEWQAAKRELELLARWEGAAPWKWEIASELAQATQALASLRQVNLGEASPVTPLDAKPESPDSGADRVAIGETHAEPPFGPRLAIVPGAPIAPRERGSSTPPPGRLAA